jgi:catechol 2,3-dioxygenase-like lactoylglutathione lyase family enzyme
MVKELAFLAYSVSDVQRSLRFYRDVIGLRPEPGMFEQTGGHWVEFDLGNATFGIGNGTGLGIEPGSSFSATFEVDDVAAMRERLLAQSVPVTEIHDGPKCTSAFVTDPDGNRFGLHERKASGTS